MAVQAQYASNVPLINRNEQERKDMDLSQSASGFLHQSSELFANGGNGNQRKRVREAVAGFPEPAMQPHRGQHSINLFGMPGQQPCSTPTPTPPPPTMISLAQLQSHPPPLVSIGLRLSFEEHKNRNEGNNRLLSTASSASSSLYSSLLSEEITAQINQQKDEIEKLILAQGEQLRRALAERRRRHYRALLSAAEDMATRRLREKEMDVERASRRRAELEDRLSRLRTESMAWQAKAMADQATAASLHAQIQQATDLAAATAAMGFNFKGENCGESPPADDAESAYIDPDRVEPQRACRLCGVRAATVVLLPCRHLCLCESCEAAAVSGGNGFAGAGIGGIAANCCPVCLCVRSGSVQVFLS